jgi:endonuclease/exonuclease/phosphatase (EEP) superfamily protein YafD
VSPAGATEWLARCGAALTALACAGTLVGFAGRRAWLAELSSHFRLIYAQWLGLAATVYWLTGAVGPAVLAAACCVANLAAIAGIYRARPTGPGTGGRLRVLTVNVLMHNRAYARVIALVRAEQPDVVLLQEVNARWLIGLRALEADYPAVKSVLLHGGFGLLALTRAPMTRAEIVRIGRATLPFLDIELSVGGRPVSVIAPHPLSPKSRSRFRLRNQQFDELAGYVRQKRGAVILAGDLNSTAWSRSFQDLLDRSGLRDSRDGIGLQPTWPVWLPVPLRLPIDHVLVSRGVQVERRRLGPPVGSDHLPVIVDCRINAGDQQGVEA